LRPGHNGASAPSLSGHAWLRRRGGPVLRIGPLSGNDGNLLRERQAQPEIAFRDGGSRVVARGSEYPKLGQGAGGLPAALPKLGDDGFNGRSAKGFGSQQRRRRRHRENVESASLRMDIGSGRQRGGQADRGQGKLLRVDLWTDAGTDLRGSPPPD